MRAFLLTLSGIYNFIVSVISGLYFAFSLDYMRNGEWPAILINETRFKSNAPYLTVFAALIPILMNLVIALTYHIITKKLADSEIEVDKIKLKPFLIINGAIYLAVMLFCILLGTSSY